MHSETARSGGGSNKLTTLYGYDALKQLTTAGPSGSQTTHCYDPVGNRVSTTAGCPQPYSITYDKADRLTSATVGGTTTTTTYNGDGLRMSQTSGRITSPAVWDVASGLPQFLYDGTRYYIDGLDLLYSINPSGLNSPSSPNSLTTHLRIDQLDGVGSVRALTDENGTLVGTQISDALGANTGQVGLKLQPFGYSGEPVDSTGLVFLRARYYDSSVGRLLSQDIYAGSASQPLSLNRYTYVLNSPTFTADPGRLSPAEPSDLGSSGSPPGKSQILKSDNPCVSSGSGSLAG